MSQKPKISFLIPTYNRADMISDALKSLVDQSISEWEAIIVDDHGTDNTEMVIDSFKDNRFRYIKLKTNYCRGPAYARNIAAFNASSDLLAVLDSDDVAYPNRAKITIKAFEDSPDAGIFYAHNDVWEEAKNIVRPPKKDFTPFSFEKLRKGNFIVHGTVAFKKKVFLNYLYNPFFKVVEDYELYTRLASNDVEFIYSKEVVMKYRVSGENVSIGKENQELMKCYEAIVKISRGWARPDAEIAKKINNLELKL